jgi:hypothetical protein
VKFDIIIPDDDTSSNDKSFRVHQDAIGSEYFSTIEEAKEHLIETIESCFSVSCAGLTDEDEPTEYAIEVKLSLTPIKKSKTPEDEGFFDLSPFRTLFKDYSFLQVLPILSWGRYYKYELAGNPFVIDCTEHGFSRYMSMMRESEENEKFDWVMLREIDKEWMHGKYQDICENIELPSHKDCVKKYERDERGGTLLAVVRSNDTLKIELMKCDSPE